MDRLPLNHILYLGRDNGLANLLRSILIHELNGNSSPILPADGLIHWQAVTNQKAALRIINGSPPQILLVETNRHASSRRHFCETVRLRIPAAPIVAVSGDSVSYQFAFDAIIQTPIEPTQVAAALRTAAVNSSAQTVTCGVFQLSLPTRTLTTPLGEHTLTPKQCALLRLFMTHPDEVIKRADIMQTIWDTSYLDDTRTLDVHVRWLREIIEPDPSSPIHLVTKRGVGYQFLMPGKATSVE